MANTYVAIATTTVGAGGTGSISFTSIPGTYTDLLVKISARTNRNVADGDDLKVVVNDSTSSIYNNIRLYGNGTGVGGDSLSSTNNAYIGMATSANQTASTFGSTEFYFANYASSNSKGMLSDGLSENNATTALSTLGVWLWASSSAITKITISPYNGTSFDQYSTFTLYGISNS